MSFEILGIKYCCALFGSGRLDDARARLLAIDIPGWIKEAGQFSHEEGMWSLSVGIATEDEEWRQDDDIADFASRLFPFLHDLSRSEGAALSLHLQYRAEAESIADFSPGTLSILAALGISLHIELQK